MKRTQAAIDIVRKHLSSRIDRMAEGRRLDILCTACGQIIGGVWIDRAVRLYPLVDYNAPPSTTPHRLCSQWSQTSYSLTGVVTDIVFSHRCGIVDQAIEERFKALPPPRQEFY